jgi:5-methylcytosine-specific restriction endonuclease McrA
MLRSKITYSEKLKHPFWQKKRLEVMARDKFTCLGCGATTTTLHVHHTSYTKGLNPWEYPLDVLKTLCEVCHKKEHDLIPEQEPERKYEHLIIRKEEPDVITAINLQVIQLTNKLKEKLTDEAVEDILKNIIYLQQTKKELLNR